MIKIIVCLSLVSITAHTDITSQKGWNTQRFCTENAPQPYSLNLQKFWHTPSLKF